MHTIEGKLDAANGNWAIVVSRWNAFKPDLAKWSSISIDKNIK